MKEFGSVDEPVVAMGEAGPEPCGDFLADIDESRAMASTKAPVLLLGSNDIGGAGEVMLLCGRVDVLTDPELVADADVVVDGRPDLGRKRRAGARDDAAAAGPAKHAAVRGGRQVRAEVVGLEVGDLAGQMLSGLSAEVVPAQGSSLWFLIFPKSDLVVGPDNASVGSHSARSSRRNPPI